MYSGFIFHSGANYYFKSVDFRWVYRNLLSFTKRCLRMANEPIYASISRNDNLVCCMYSVGSELIIQKGVR